ncbi:MAG TPA: Gfo/Idh/MocA family oxidoreductase [Opitutales bacterium]|nr:Gfo/Idh/MocA family oxidoreductase [Opitutales bacterium]
MSPSNGSEKIFKEPRVAVLGCGYWGKNLVRNFHALGALALVCDPGDPGRAMAREIAPRVEVTRDFETAFQRDGIDGIVIATPAETHHQLAMRALGAGKDLYVEKPLALTYREGVAMRNAAASRGKILMVGHLLEYHPAILKLRELLDEGELGKVDYIYSNRLNFGKVRTEENALWSFAPHDIAVILRIAGELPVEVTCVGGSYLTPALHDVTLSCLRFRSGLRAHIFVSWLNPFKEQKLVVVGDRKMAVFNDVLKEGKLVVHNQRVEMRDHIPVLHNGNTVQVEHADEEPLRNECRHFLDCIRHRCQPLTGGKEGTDVLLVLQACQESLEKGGVPIELDHVPDSSFPAAAAG